MKGNAYLGCRLFAIYWFIKAIVNLAYIAGINLPDLWDLVGHKSIRVGFPSESFPTLIFLFVTIVYAIAAVVLWRKAEPLSTLLVPSDPQPQEASPQNYHFVLILALSGIGLYIFLAALPRLVSAIYESRVFIPHQSGIPLIARLSVRAEIVHLSLEMVLGASTLFGARLLSHLLLRSAKAE